MRWTRTEDRDGYFIEQARLTLAGEREVPAITYHRRGNEFHLSDFDLCVHKTLLRLTRDDAPKLSPDSVLKFMRGRAIERFFGTEVEPLEVDGIIMTPDGTCPWGLYEFKTTNTDSSRFKPNTARSGVYPHWEQRMLGYMRATGADAITLAVYFLSGNTPSHKGQMPGRESVALQTFEGRPDSPNEVAENWDKILARKAALLDALNNATPLPDKYTGEPWECKGCQFSEACDRWRAF